MVIESKSGTDLKKRREGMEKSMKGHIYTLKTDSRAKRRS
jgi:hypothetical protein